MVKEASMECINALIAAKSSILKWKEMVMKKHAKVRDFLLRKTKLCLQALPIKILD